MTASNRAYKYDKVTRKKIRTAIRKLAREGVKYGDMVEPLTKQGFTTPRGTPITGDTIQSQAHQSGLRVHKKRRVFAAKQQAAEQLVFDDSTILADLILDAKIPDAKKITLLKNLRKQG